MRRSPGHTPQEEDPEDDSKLGLPLLSGESAGLHEVFAVAQIGILLAGQLSKRPSPLRVVA